MKKILMLCALLVWTQLQSQTYYDAYISDAGNFNNGPWQILKATGTGSGTSVFIDTMLNWPQDILFWNNEVLISNFGSGCINRHDKATGDYIGPFACNISGPTRIVIGPDTNLYVLQWLGNGLVRKYGLDGTNLGAHTSVGVTQSIGIDWDSHDNMYVSSFSGKMVRKFDPNGNDLGVFVDSNLAGPTNIWIDRNDELLVMDYNGNAVKRYDTNGQYMSDFITGLGKAEGVAFHPDGYIFIGNGNTSSVKQFDTLGNYLSERVPSGANGLLNPNAVVLDQIVIDGIDAPVEEESLLVYPTNGRSFQVNVELAPRIRSVSIANMKGEVFMDNISRSGHTFQLDHLPPGAYILSAIMHDETVMTQKIVVQ